MQGGRLPIHRSPSRDLWRVAPTGPGGIIRLGGLAALATGGDKDVVTKQLYQKLAVSLVRGNASLILSRIPSHPSPDLDGDIDLDF